MKKNRTFEDYERLGAKFRLLMEIASNTKIDYQRCFGVTRSGKLDKVLDLVNYVLTEVEDIFYEEKFLPSIDIDAWNMHTVFHSNLKAKPQNEFDEDVHWLAKEFVRKEIFGYEWIKPEEHLPDYDVNVLVLNNKDCFVGRRDYTSHTGWVLESPSGLREWRCDAWQYLPDLPDYMLEED